MKLYKVIILIMILALSFNIYSKTDPASILEKGDVEKFIKTWPLLEKDLNQFGMKMDAKKGKATIPEAILTGQKYLGILKKHGWDENFFQKFIVIITGYSSLQYKSVKPEVDSQIAKSIKEIKSHPQLSEEMKKQLIENLGAVKGAMKQQGNALIRNINPKDLAFIKINMKKIKILFEKDKNRSK